MQTAGLPASWDRALPAGSSCESVGIELKIIPCDWKAQREMQIPVNRKSKN